ncbi:cardiolipin synthase [Ulvibacterium marinum]|uniref:cardiolipin synthase n=1 Tax=Ulvibacterium marinum TaxID=2419782 RepID=UPI002494BA4D|nr:cardiolipin synthase [Ulvibacterium marinum]
MFLTILLVLYFLTAIILVMGLLVNGARPTKTLAWLLAIFTIPVGGILFYFVLGRNKRKNKFFELKKTPGISEYLNKVDDYYRKLDEEKVLPEHVREQVKLVKLLTKSSKFLPSAGNALLPLKNGPSAYTAIFDALENAKKYIHIQYYIFEEGELADNFLQLLKRKVKEGVKVRFLYDGFGSWELSRTFIQSLESSGIEVASFLPMRFGKFLSSLNYRNHRKIVVVDGRIGFTGGINISDKYIKGDPDLGMWLDTHLMIEGPLVRSLQAVFAMDWCFASGKEDVLSAEHFLEETPVGQSFAQVVASGPDSDFASVRQLYFSIVNSAKQYVYIINPYIVPGEALLEALQVCALAGVDVRLLLSSKSDSRLVKWSVRSYFEDMLRAGVKIYLYPEGFLHSKVIISDDRLTSIGTANLDVRSFEQNYEINVLTYGEAMACELKKDFIRDCEISSQIDYNEFRKRPLTERLKEGAAKIFSPLL